MSREAKKHWAGERKSKGVWREVYALCGRINQPIAKSKRSVTCKTCARILAGYQTKEK